MSFIGAAVGAVGGALIGGLLGNKQKPSAQIDTSSAAAAASLELGNRQQDLAEKQYADQQELFKSFEPMLKEQISKSLVAQDKSTAQSDDAWADYNKTWKPVEQKLAADSLDYATPGRQEAEAARAASDTKGAFDQAAVQSRRSLEMAGASPEKIAALEAAGRLQEAKAVGGAESVARRDVESKGMAYLDNAARFGRSMPSTGIATAGLAGSQGAQAQGGYGGLSAASSAPAQSASSLFGAANSAYGTAGNTAIGSGGLQIAANKQANDTMFDFAGAGLQGYGMFASSRKLKRVGKKVDGRAASDAIKATPSKEWSYKAGEGDGNVKARMGPIAEELSAVSPMVSDGMQVDGISMLGLHHSAIGDQASRIDKLERRLSLADAKEA